MIQSRIQRHILRHWGLVDKCEISLVPSFQLEVLQVHGNKEIPTQICFQYRYLYIS